MIIATTPRPTPHTQGAVLRYRLRPEEAKQAAELAEEHTRRYHDDHGEGFAEEMGFAAQGLPGGLREFLHRARLHERTHAIVVEGNAVADAELGPTPSHWKSAHTAISRRYAFLLLLHAGLLGEVIGWRAQQSGRVVTDVLPIPGQEYSQVSSCSEAELGWHTEDAFSPYRADYVGLLCLRGSPEAATTLSFVDPSGLHPEVLRALREPRFEIVPDSSHESSMIQTNGLSPLLYGHPDAPVVRVDRDFVRVPEGDVEGRHAFTELVRHLDNNIYEVVLEAGDVCFIDNRNVVHGRRPFHARRDGQDRWLKRVNIVTDLRRTRPGRRSADTRIVG